ncbi:hypothetical protein ACQP1V_27455 [Microtetraspora malaysiensis]|uniref:hypothetical protein n=1 Tax=Microtetraspora malaysiensis TaxID=161358 RepID=UPI003D941A39
MLDLPAIWAEVWQYALPLWVTPRSAGADSRSEAEKIITCWRGLLARRLVTGHIQPHRTNPLLDTLHLQDTAAPWLLAAPPRATAWARAYERTYPGSLAQIGIPTLAYATPENWMSWLATSP